MMACKKPVRLVSDPTARYSLLTEQQSVLVAEPHPTTYQACACPGRCTLVPPPPPVYAVCDQLVLWPLGVLDVMGEVAGSRHLHSSRHNAWWDKHASTQHGVKRGAAVTVTVKLAWDSQHSHHCVLLPDSELLQQLTMAAFLIASPRTTRARPVYATH